LICYFDTSAVIPLLVDEASSDVAGRLVWCRPASCTPRCVLRWLRRIGPTGSMREASDGWSPAWRVSWATWIWSKWGPSVLHRAGQLAELLAPRGHDAVDLGSAESLADPDLVLVTGDR
jgi:hypothetical protein